MIDPKSTADDLPELDDPVVVVAFEGWNDAGDAATGAVEHEDPLPEQGGELGGGIRAEQGLHQHGVLGHRAVLGIDRSRSRRRPAPGPWQLRRAARRLVVLEQHVHVLTSRARDAGAGSRAPRRPHRAHAARVPRFRSGALGRVRRRLEG